MFKNKFIDGPESLLTTREARRSGFLEIALRKNEESIPYLDMAKALYVKLANETKSCDDLLKMAEYREAFLEAAGYSKKTKATLTEEDKCALLREFVAQVLRPCGDKYVDEVVYRYLMALGEQLGGRMKNIIGVVARGKLSRAIIAQLKLAQFDFCLYDDERGWYAKETYSKSDAEKMRAIQWANGDYVRTLAYNVNVPNVSKNIDIVVLNRKISDLKPKTLQPILEDTKNFILMGELKGGIDPAGADEHWKTAGTALRRIRQTFQNRISIVFVGGAIEKAMAKEIYAQLVIGDLSYVANLTNENQLASLCEWMVRQ